MRPALEIARAPLTSGGEVVAWLVEQGLLPEATPAPAGLAREAQALRDVIASCVEAAARDVPPPPEALERVDDWLVLAGNRPALRPGADGHPVLGERASDSPRRALGMLALDAARLLGTPEERRRLRVCDGCGEVFLDRSPAGRRRWCSMATCGNRAKARRHRAAHRGAA